MPAITLIPSWKEIKILFLRWTFYMFRWALGNLEQTKGRLLSWIWSGLLQVSSPHAEGDQAAFCPPHRSSVHCWMLLWDAARNNGEDHHPVLNTVGSLPHGFKLSWYRKTIPLLLLFYLFKTYETTGLKNTSTWKYKLSQFGRRKMTKLHYLGRRH